MSATDHDNHFLIKQTVLPLKIALKPLITVRLWCNDNEHDDDTRAVGQECNVFKGIQKCFGRNWLRIFKKKKVRPRP